MKTKKLCLILGLLTFAFILTTSQPADAANAWYTCEIIATGPGSSNMFIQLTDVEGAFSHKWCIFPPERAKEFLAVALSALTAGRTVRVYVDKDISYPTVISMYLY